MAEVFDEAQLAAAAALERSLAEDDGAVVERDPEERWNPYEYVPARAEEIIAFARAMRDAPPEDWQPQDLATLDRMHELLGEEKRRRVMAVGAAEQWLKARASADPQKLLSALTAVDRAFAQLKLTAADRAFAQLELTAAEIAMLHDTSPHAFEALRVVAVLALRCKALGLPRCDDPLSPLHAVNLDAAADLLKKTRARYRER